MNPKNSTKWYRKAAKLGHGDSMYTLAICYFDGEGVTQNRKKGLYWIEQYQEYYHLSDWQKRKLTEKGIPFLDE